MLSVSSCSSRARSRFRAIRAFWAVFCGGARSADRGAVGGAAEGRMEEGRASGEESEADTSPPDSPSKAEEESGRVELARTPREPRAAKVKSPGGFHRGQRAWQGFRQKRKIPQTPAQAVPLLPKTPGEEYGTPRVVDLNAWETSARLWSGGHHSGTGRKRPRHLCRRLPCLVLRGGAESGTAVLPYLGPVYAPKRPGVCRITTPPVPLRVPPHGNSHGTVPWRQPKRLESLQGSLGEPWRLSSHMMALRAILFM